MTTDESPFGEPESTAVGIDHVETIVSSVDDAIAWYERVLGLRVQTAYDRWAEGGGPVILSGDGGGTKLALFDGHGGAGEENADRGSTGFRRVAFGVDGDAFSRFLEFLPDDKVTDSDGASITAADVVDHDLSRSLYFADPDGNPLELTTYDRPERPE